MTKPGPKEVPVLERMAAKSEWRPGPLATDCLVFTGSTDRKGYGRVTMEGVVRGAHRISYVLHFGQPPGDRPCVLHRCDNPPCWNPEHLWAGTNAQNTDDMMQKGRHRTRPRPSACPRGHEYTEENTRISKVGVQVCRQCARDRWHARTSGAASRTGR